MMMPTSNRPQYHKRMPGGYIDHVCRVVDIALDTKDMWSRYGSIINFTDEELVFSALNHYLGKFGTEENAAYIEQTDQWRKDKLNEILAIFSESGGGHAVVPYAIEKINDSIKYLYIYDNEYP